MSQPAPADFESMLRLALHPVDPPESLKVRVESTLQELTDAAVDELESWEIGAMSDPRNWVRPVIAGVVSVSAGTALVVLRVRAERKKRREASRNPIDLMGRTARAAAGEARKIARRV